ncbi:MAG: hypothetical protein J6V57_03305 [Spirochaetaceae bacterium]|nr:hypothetical protein [Spirochaetaceae bacterium]
MSALRINNKLELSPLNNSLKKTGFARWRYLFNAKNSFNGEGGSFFIELYLINPGLSPDEVIWSDPHAIPAFKDESQLFMPEEAVSPHSYVAIRVGMPGLGGKVIQNFLPASSLCISKNLLDVANGAFHLENEFLSGVAEDENKYASWQLKIEKLCQFAPRKMQKEMYWGVPAVRCFISGELQFCGETYIVEPGTSFGYVDKLWGKDYPYPFFHLSCSHISSIITGKPLVNAAFAVQGIYRDSFALFAEIDTVKLSRPRVKNKPNFGCVVMENKVHWTVSVPFHHHLVDIDVFCPSDEMSVRSYSCPSNPREELQVLGGSTGTGELRLYRKIKKKSLELIEHAILQDVRCEYGGREQADFNS